MSSSSSLDPAVAFLPFPSPQPFTTKLFLTLLKALVTKNFPPLNNLTGLWANSGGLSDLSTDFPFYVTLLTQDSSETLQKYGNYGKFTLYELTIQFSVSLGYFNILQNIDAQEKEHISSTSLITPELERMIQIEIDDYMKTESYTSILAYIETLESLLVSSLQACVDVNSLLTSLTSPPYSLPDQYATAAEKWYRTNRVDLMKRILAQTVFANQLLETKWRVDIPQKSLRQMAGKDTEKEEGNSTHDINYFMEPTALFELTLFNNNAKQVSSTRLENNVNTKNNINENIKPSLSTVRFEASRNSLDQMVIELEKINDIFTKFA